MQITSKDMLAERLHGEMWIQSCASSFVLFGEKVPGKVQQ